MDIDNNGKHHWRNLAFNFDSAAGIDYEVDVTKEKGHKVKILRMSDGRPFSEENTYKVFRKKWIKWDVDNEEIEEFYEKCMNIVSK